MVLDGAKALRKAVRDVLSADTPVQRCVRHYPDSTVMPMRIRGAGVWPKSAAIGSA